MERRTKIVATLGPASSTPEAIAALVAAGMDVARLNLSHGDVAEHVQRAGQVRAAAAAAGRTVGVLVDLPGPKVRCGSFPDGGVTVAPGGTVVLAEDAGPSTAERIAVAADGVVAGLEPGDRVVVGDGAVSLVVLDRETAAGAPAVRAMIRSGGRLLGRPGVHVPAARSSLSAPTPEDLALLAAMAPAEPDFVAVSFVRRPEDLHAVRRAAGPGPLLVAKIETRPAVEDLHAVIEAADVVMVARGDLGIDFPVEDVPILQKQIVSACIEAGVPVVTATQMLESMVVAPLPTRAEVSDVANAVLDGTDAVMLSGETAIGADPPGAVAAMARVVRRTEQGVREAGGLLPGPPAVGLLRELAGRWDTPGLHHDEVVAVALARAAWSAAAEAEATAIVCVTRTGLIARLVARLRPASRLVGVSPDRATLAQLTVSWGVEPVALDLGDVGDGPTGLAEAAARATRRAGVAEPGDTLVVLASSGPPPARATNLLVVLREEPAVR